MCKARRRACRTVVLGIPGAFGEGRSRDKEPESEFPSDTCDSDIDPTFLCYPAYRSGRSELECGDACGAYAGTESLGLL